MLKTEKTRLSNPEISCSVTILTIDYVKKVHYIVLLDQNPLVLKLANMISFYYCKILEQSNKIRFISLENHSRSSTRCKPKLILMDSLLDKGFLYLSPNYSVLYYMIQIGSCFYVIQLTR